MKGKNLSPHEVESFKNLLERPEANGLDFPPLSELFEETEEATDRRELYDNYIKRVNRNKASIPITMFYRIMDTKYKQKISDNGELGYCVRIVEEPKN